MSDIKVGDKVRVKTYNGTHVTGEVTKVIKGKYSSQVKVEGLVGLVNTSEVVRSE